jgi:type II secretory pathway component PulK
MNVGGKKGSALIMALWAVGLMSVAVIGLVLVMQTGMEELAMQSKDFRTRQLAESGIALGLHPQIAKTDPVLRQEFPGAESFEVHLRSEGARLNINRVLFAKKERFILSTLFRRWGLEREEADALLDHLVDWVDEDDLKQLNGAEWDDYEKDGKPGWPPNRPLQSVEEMALVPGMERIAELQPDWADFFTVYGDGKLDLNEAPAALIEAVCETGQYQAEKLVERRLGPDEEADTKDDVLLENTALVKAFLGLSNAVFERVEPRITVKSDYRRIVSTGRIGKYERKIEAVAAMNTTPLRFLYWSEQ